MSISDSDEELIRLGIEAWMALQEEQLKRLERIVLHPSTVDVCWIDDNDGAGPRKLSRAVRCY